MGIGHEWVVQYGVTCVVCPDCGFTFDASHEDGGGGYSCPNCVTEPAEPPTEAGEQGIRVGTLQIDEVDGEWHDTLTDDYMDIESLTSLPVGRYPVFLASPPPSGEPTEEGRPERIARLIDHLDSLDCKTLVEDAPVGWRDDGREIAMTFGDVRWLRSHLRALAPGAPTDSRGEEAAS